jgi:hypothetical protein
MMASFNAGEGSAIAAYKGSGTTHAFTVYSSADSTTMALRVDGSGHTNIGDGKNVILNTIGRARVARRKTSLPVTVSPVAARGTTHDLTMNNHDQHLSSRSWPRSLTRPAARSRRTARPAVTNPRISV